jgi:hypothetical protein
VVFVGSWGSEQGEDPIARGLHDVAFVAMYRIDHEPQSRIDNGACLLGVEVRHQLQRTLDVGK